MAALNMNEGAAAIDDDSNDNNNNSPTSPPRLVNIAILAATGVSDYEMQAIVKELRLRQLGNTRATTNFVSIADPYGREKQKTCIPLSS